MKKIKMIYFIVCIAFLFNSISFSEPVLQKQYNLAKQSSFAPINNQSLVDIMKLTAHIVARRVIHRVAHL